MTHVGKSPSSTIPLLFVAIYAKNYEFHKNIISAETTSRLLAAFLYVAHIMGLSSFSFVW